MPSIKYLKTVPELPASSPRGAPHIININSLHKVPKNADPPVSVLDMIVTLLYNRDPLLLDAFLDMEIKSFKFRRNTVIRDNGPSLCEDHFEIRRDGRSVEVLYKCYFDETTWIHQEYLIPTCRHMVTKLSPGFEPAIAKHSVSRIANAILFLVSEQISTTGRQAATAPSQTCKSDEDDADQDQTPEPHLVVTELRESIRIKKEWEIIKSEQYLDPDQQYRNALLQEGVDFAREVLERKFWEDAPCVDIEIWRSV